MNKNNIHDFDRIIKAKSDKKIAVIIPAYNEESSILCVLQEIPKFLVNEIVVVDNNSNDNTAQVAKDFGATVLHEKRKGYGSACLKGLDYLADKNFDIVVFIDADYSDFPEEMLYLIEEITLNNFDLVIGSRTRGNLRKGALTPQQIFGNWLAVGLIKIIFKQKFSDLGPFRAVTTNALKKIDMQDTNYGWTVEMQVKCAKHKLKCKEIPVSYRPRIGTSKISGTINGTIKAGYKILFTIAKYSFK